MAIDRIGGKGAAPPAPEAEVPAKPAAPFNVKDAGAARGAEAASQVAPSSALQRLRAGEIDANGYVELKVEEATRHLHGLRPADLEAIRDELRERLSSDPALGDLVQAASGTRPAPKDDSSGE